MAVKIRQQIKILMKKIQKWWHGEIPEDDPSSNIVFIGFVHSDSSILAHKIWDYFKKEHKFVIGTIIAVVGIIIKVLW